MGILDSKIAMVTGAGAGIGRASALTLSREGASVVAVDINDEGARETVTMIHERGGQAMALNCNVAEAASVEMAINKIIEKFGRLDCAHNNAGIEGPAGLTADYEESDWDKVMAVNLKGVWLCMKYQIRAMLGTGGGVIVNTSSALGQVGITNLPAYVASKHGVIGVTRAAALDHAQQGIRINAVAPGVIDTPLMARRIEEMPEIEAPLKAAHPIGRLGKPAEVAEAVAWLCSDAASFVTGSVLSVDGGYLTA